MCVGEGGLKTTSTELMIETSKCISKFCKERAER